MMHLFDITIHLPQLWFQGLSSHSTTDFIIVCVVVGVVCLLKTCLACLASICFNNRTILKSKEHRSRGMRVLCHIAGTIVRILDFALGYMLMLAFMVGNLWICIVIVAVSGLSYFLTSWSRIPLHRPHQQKILDTDGHESTELTSFLTPAPAAGDVDKLLQYTPKTKPTFLSPEDRKSMDVGGVLQMSTFNRNHDQSASGSEYDTMLEQPDLIPGKAAVGAATNRSETPVMIGTPSSQRKTRSDSDPLLQKYPVLRFHNIDIQDTSPVHEASKSLEFDELDQLIKDLQE